MRIVFATTNYALVDDLVRQYAGVEIGGILGAYSDAIGITSRSSEYEAIDCVVLDEHLASPRDDSSNLTIRSALAALRTISPSPRLVVLSTISGNEQEYMLLGALNVIVSASESSASNLAEVLDIEKKADTARLYAIAGIQGGAGRTRIAKGVATALAATAGRGKVLLWEADIFRPSTLAYDLESPANVVGDGGRKTVARLIGDVPFPVADRVEALRRAVVTPEASHYPHDTLYAPYSMREILAVHGGEIDIQRLTESLTHILAAAQNTYRYVVADIGTNLILDPTPALLLRAADRIVLVVTPTAGGLSSALAYRDIFSDLHITDRSGVVFNRTGSDQSYMLAIKKALGSDIRMFGRIGENADNDTAFATLASRLEKI